MTIAQMPKKSKNNRGVIDIVVKLGIKNYFTIVIIP